MSSEKMYVSGEVSHAPEVRPGNASEQMPSNITDIIVSCSGKTQQEMIDSFEQLMNRANMSMQEVVSIQDNQKKIHALNQLVSDFLDAKSRKDFGKMNEISRSVEKLFD